MVKWMKSRLNERTSLDGLAIIVMAVLVLIAGPIAKLAAYAAIAYGLWTIWKKEKESRETRLQFPLRLPRSAIYFFLLRPTDS